MAVDLALVADVLPDSASVAKDLGVMDILGALPLSIGPALAPMVLAAGGGSYASLSAVGGASALAGAGAILCVIYEGWVIVKAWSAPGGWQGVVGADRVGVAGTGQLFCQVR